MSRPECILKNRLNIPHTVGNNQRRASASHNLKGFDQNEHTPLIVWQNSTLSSLTVTLKKPMEKQNILTSW